MGTKNTNNAVGLIKKNKKWKQNAQFNWVGRFYVWIGLAFRKEDLWLVDRAIVAF